MSAVHHPHRVLRDLIAMPRITVVAKSAVDLALRAHLVEVKGENVVERRMLVDGSSDEVEE
jgi:hypothetical protein